MNMSILSLPKDKNWDVSYEHDGAAFVNETYNVDLFSYPNKLISGPKIIPHTVDSDIANMSMATAFAYTNYSGGNRAYVALCGQLLKASSIYDLFAAATSESAPTDLYDSDFVIHGLSSGGYDIAVLSNFGNLSRFNYDINSTQWNTTWWTGNRKIISSTTNATPVVVTTSTSHGYSTGDQVVIRNNLIAALNNTWTINVISSTTFSLNGSTAPGSTSGSGYVYRIYDNTNQRFESLGQPALDSSVSHQLMVFGNAPLLFVGDKNKVHSVAPPYTNADGTITQPGPDDVQYSRLAFKKNYTIKWMKANSSTIFFGLSNDMGSYFPSLVEVYDPFSEQVREYQIDEGSTMGFIYDNNLFIIDVKGNIRFFNGSSFEKKNAFPSIAYRGRYINLPHRNGIVSAEGRIFILLPSAGSGAVRSGIWCYEPSQNRLYHYSSITLSGTTSNSYGETYTTGSYGALFFADAYAFLVGAYLQASVLSPVTSVTGIFSSISKPLASPSVSLTDTISRFITGKIYSDTIDSAFKRLIIKYNPTPTMLGYTPTGRIITWYRMSDDSQQRLTKNGTWTSSTTFTTPSSHAPSVGESIEIVTGIGSGIVGSVTAVSAPSGGVVTVTISESPLIITPSGSFYYVKSNWKRLPATNDITSSTMSWAEIDIPENQATWIQFMIESRGFFAIESIQLGAQDGLRVEKN